MRPTRRKSTRGFLLNHLIAELLPEQPGGYRFSNSDPVTGQAAWYDLKVRIEKAGAARGQGDLAALRARSWRRLAYRGQTPCLNVGGKIATSRQGV